MHFPFLLSIILDPHLGIMRKIILFGLVFCALIFGTQTASAQSQKAQQIADQVFENRRQLYFEFNIQSRDEIHVLTNTISIDRVNGLTVTAYANKMEFINFLDLGYRHYTILTSPGDLIKVPMMKDFVQGQKTLSLTAYPTYSQYVAIMQQFATDYPEICSLHHFGTTVDGRSLLALKITDNLNVREYEPQFFYTSTMHGDETAGYIVMLKYIDYLLSNYGTNPRVTNLVNNMEIWINPLANPDGTYAAGDNNVNGAIRYNSNNIDLNRNYWDPQDGPHPDGNTYQPETMAFMAFADSMDFVMAANFHGGAEVYNYPWDTKVNAHPDLNWFQSVGFNYADTVQSNSTNYFIQNDPGFDGPGVTNGFAWYEVNGGRQDYMNAYQHCREITVELSMTKLIPASEFENHWNYNRNSLMYFMEETFNGFHGLITDACTGQAVKAKVFVNGHDADSSHVYSSLPIGNYYRPIYPGTYSVTYSAPGYQSVTINNIVVTAGTGIEQNVTLQPLAPVSNFIADHTSGCGGVVSFTDLTGSATSWNWNFGDGQTSTEQNPVHSYAQSGTYTVTLSVDNCAGADDEIKTGYINVSVMELPVVAQDNFSVCAPQSFDLSANGSGSIAWYDAAVGGNVVATGSNFTTPVLNASTTYYVENQVDLGSATVGSTNLQANGGYYTAGTYHYLTFDALSSFTLVSVQVNANTSGNRTIDLRDNAGNVLQSVTVNIPQGVSTVNLGFTIAPGSYQLGTSGGNNLWRNNAAAVYPYTLDGVVSIIGNSAANSNYYYYFYQWNISQTCSSARVPVIITVGNNQAPSVTVTNPSSVICSGEPTTFTATTANTSSPVYTWTVNGMAVAETSNTLTIAAPTDGVVVCSITDATNCSGVTSATNTFNVVVTPTPATPVVTMSGNLLSVNSTTGIQWYMNGSIIVGATSPTYLAAANGDYSVVVSNGSCVSAMSNTVTYTITGVEENQMVQVQLYPNPVRDEMQVVTTQVEGFDWSLYNALGQCIQQGHHSSANLQMNVAHLEKGIYTWVVMGSEITVKQFVVEK